jgi:probable F420-dependent oxidoreductase
MIPRQRIAATLPDGPRVQDSIKRARWAEEAGYDDLWIAESASPDALTLAAVLAGETKRLRIGTAVISAFSRSPAVLASTASVLGQVLPGRFVLGLGSSSETMVTGWHGMAFDKPMSRVRDMAVMVRAMLKGEKTSFDLETLKSHGYRQAPLETPVPIYIAALRSRMIEMAAEFGDGIIFNLWPRRALSKMMGHLRIGAERGHKNPASIEIVNRHMVLVTDDKAHGRALFRKQFAPYYATSVYNSFLAWGGYEETAAAIREGWAARDRDKTTGALTDEIIDEIGIIGTEEECRARLRWCAKSGIHTHIIAPLEGATPEEAQRTYEAFGGLDLKT